MAELETIDRDTPLAAILDALKRDGGVIVRDLLPDDAADRIVADLAPTYAATAPGSRSGLELWETFHGRSTIRFTGLAAHSDAFVEHALLNPILLGVADQVQPDVLQVPHALEDAA